LSEGARHLFVDGGVEAGSQRPKREGIQETVGDAATIRKWAKERGYGRPRLAGSRRNT
jgi:hypothetical protein